MELRWDKDLLQPAGVVLRGLNETHAVPFTVPAGRVVNSARAILRFRHSPALIAPSTLTVAVNGTPLATVKLTDGNANGGTLETAIPTGLLKDYNRLELLAAQHYTLGCEDPFEASLWTAVTTDSRLVLDIGGYKQFPTLNQFPRPLADPLDYRPPALRFVIPEGASAATYGIAAAIAGELGARMEFRAAQLRAVSTLELTAGESQVLVGTAAELRSLPTTQSILEAMPGSGGGLGFLRLVENRNQPGRFLLVVSGQDAQGLEKAATALLRRPEIRALSAATAIIERVEGPAVPRRAGMLPPADSFTLRQLLPESGAGGITVRGLNPGPIQLRLRPLGGEQFVRYEQKIRLEYAYGPQVDTSRSAIEVTLNGKALRGEALAKASGSSRESLEVSVPEHALGLDNLLEVQFHLYPRNWNYCEKFSNDFLWATLRETSWFRMPRDRYARMPDLALLRHSGFPLADEPAAFLLPARPLPEEVALLLHSAFWLGRVAGRSPQEAYFDDQVPESVKNSHHLVAVGLPERNLLARQALQRLMLHYAAPAMALHASLSVRLAARQPTNDGFIEEAISPWNSRRVLIVFSGATANGLQWAAAGLTDADLLPQIEGALVLFHPDGKLSSFPPSHIVPFGNISLTRRMKYFVLDYTAWLAVCSLAFLTLMFFLLRFLRRRFFQPPPPEDSEASATAASA